jgi:hypothetical protein
VPVPAGEVYFNAFPVVSVVGVDVGQSVAVEIDALADGPMGAWRVTAEDWTDPATRYLSFAIGGATQTDAGPALAMKSGDRTTLTVTLLADPANAPAGEADAVLVSRDVNGGVVTRGHVWPFVVLTPAEAKDAGLQRRR